MNDNNNTTTEVTLNPIISSFSTVSYHPITINDDNNNDHYHNNLHKQKHNKKVIMKMNIKYIWTKIREVFHSIQTIHENFK